MTTVYLVVGWFGDREWIERAYSDEAEADAHVQRLWDGGRTSEMTPKYARGVAKFATQPLEVVCVTA